MVDFPFSLKLWGIAVVLNTCPLSSVYQYLIADEQFTIARPNTGEAVV